MGLVDAFDTGVSGLNAFEQQINVIGNNIANVQTTGFKESDVGFKDQFYQLLSGASPATGNLGGTNPIEEGLGVQVADTLTNQTQGQIALTGQNTNMAINGQGFFVVQTPNGQEYTRNGNFVLNENHVLVDTSGNFVQGFQAVNGVVNPNGAVGNLSIPLGQLSIAQQTSLANFGGNFNSSVPTAVGFGTGVAAGSTFNVGFQIYDSLGNTHNLTITFSKANTNPGGPVVGVPAAPGGTSWTYQVTTADPAIGGLAIAGYVPIAGGGANPGAGADGNIAFGPTGQVLNTADSTGFSVANGVQPVLTVTYINGGVATPETVNLNFNNFTQLNGTTSATLSSQNGVGLGTLNNFTIAQNGLITGTFSNGLNQNLGQVAAAQFSNAQGLQSNGNNLYIQTPNSGVAQISQFTTNGTGDVVDGALEGSNVDLGKEFTTLIVAQNAYQANAKTIIAANQILQVLTQQIPAT